MNECNIVNDLLPLYADELASPDSVEFIRRHTAWCAECSGAWERISTRLPDVSPAEEVIHYKKGLRKAKRKLFLRSFVLCVITLTIAAFFISFQLYNMGFLRISQRTPSPDGNIVIEVVEKKDVPLFYHGDGLMLRFRLYNKDGNIGGVNRYETDWDTLTAHWSDNSKLVVFDAVTITGEHSIFITDATLQYRGGGLPEIQGMTDDLIPIFEEALRSEVDIGELTFSFGRWHPDGVTAYFRYEMESGYIGSIDYHYPTATITSIR